jgi:hypothetical protein
MFGQLLTVALFRNHSKGQLYSFHKNNYKMCHGVPLILEHFGNAHADVDKVQQKLDETMALWKRPKYFPYLGYFFTLFNLVITEFEISSKMILQTSNLTVVDAAAMLGFDVNFSFRGRSNSEGNEQSNNEPETCYKGTMTDLY